MKYLVAALDPNGCPRAYGVSSDAEAAKRRCLDELTAYKAKKAEVGDELATATFTYKTWELPNAD